MCLIYAFNYIMQENNLIGFGMDCHGDYKSPRNDGGYADFVDCYGNGSRLIMMWEGIKFWKKGVLRIGRKNLARMI